MPATQHPDASPGADVPESRPDLSSIPEEFLDGRSDAARRRDAAKERAERYRRRRRNQLLAVFVFSALLLGGVLLAVLVSKMGAPQQAQTAPVTNICTEDLTPASPQQTKVNVYNMTTKPGLASDIAEKLREKKFGVGTIGNYSGALEMPARTSVTAIIKSNAAMKPQALAVQRQLNEAIFQLDDTRKTKDVDVYILDASQKFRDTVSHDPGGLVCK